MVFIRTWSCLALGLLGCTASAGSPSASPDTADMTGDTTGSQPTASSTATSEGESVHVGQQPSPTSSVAESSGGSAPTDATASTSSTSDAGVNGKVVCDSREVVCKRVEPTCELGFVPRVIDGCYGDCIAVGECVCNGPDACPQREMYTCNNSRQRCTPYLN